MDNKISKKILKDLFYNLPTNPFSEMLPQAELEGLFYIKTGEYLPQGLNEKTEKIITSGKEKEYMEVLIAMAERRLKQYTKKRNVYPSMKNDLNKKIEGIRKYIHNLKKLKENNS